MFYLANIHTISPMVFSVLNTSKNKSLVSKDIYDKFYDTYLKSVVRYSNETNAVNEIKQLLTNEEIYHVFFKGTEIREYYPDPASRVMGDIDLLIYEKDRPKVVDLFINNGYKLDVDYGDVWTFEKVNNSNIQIELHINIVYKNNVRNTLESYFKNPMQFASFNSDYSGHFDVNFNLFYLLVHLAKHFYDGGAGIRLVTDIAVFMKKFNGEIDCNKVYDFLNENSLSEFADNIFSLCNFWYGTPLPREIEFDVDFLKSLSLKIVNHGVFGKINSNDAVKLSRRNNEEKGKIKTIFDLFFPSYTTMCETMVYMKFLRGKAYLTPFAWIYRWAYCAKAKGKSSVKLVSDIVDTDLEKNIEQENQFLKKLGI